MNVVQRETLAQPYQFTRSLDERNRITVPAEIIGLMNLKKGDKVVLDLIGVVRVVKE